MEKAYPEQVPSPNLNTLVKLGLRGYDTTFQSKFKGVYRKYFK